MTYWSRSFQGLAENLSEVRRFTAAVIGNRPGADLVVLAASELAGNAVLHSASGLPGGQFVVHVAVFADRWHIRVDDQGGLVEPTLVETDPEQDEPAESGRGLALIEAISKDWGVLGDAYARAVWAVIPCPAPAGEQTAGGVLAGGAVGDLEAALDAIAAALDGRLPALTIQNSDSIRSGPGERDADAAPPDPTRTPPVDDRGGRGGPCGPGRWGTPTEDDDEPGDLWPDEADPEGPPCRARLLAAGVTELEAMLIEMAYAETVGRV